MDVGENTNLGDRHTSKKFVQLLVVADGKLKVTGDDSGLLVVTGCIACQLEDLGGQILENSSQVDWGSSTDTLGVVTTAQKSVHTADWELKPSTC
ncbi:unnamed protein product [Dibothriocephalus latus]|uniref:Uncharacterized protein n=1 Tax=Dibothriocephalus latus TaxID=60516 RepID=A0A3P6PZW5_DIBLA|nr:unnamed protein product [Dibothriocephalus latus]